MSTTPKLDALLECWPESDMGDALKEIRDHIQRMSPAQPTLEQQLKTARLEVEAEMLKCAEPTRYPSELETLLHSALVDIARALERRCYRTATKKAKDALAKVPSNIFDV